MTEWLENLAILSPPLLIQNEWIFLVIHTSNYYHRIARTPGVPTPVNRYEGKDLDEISPVKKIQKVSSGKDRSVNRLVAEHYDVIKGKQSNLSPKVIFIVVSLCYWTQLTGWPVWHDSSYRSACNAPSPSINTMMTGCWNDPNWVFDIFLGIH